MALDSTPIRTLDDLFVRTLQDMYYAENQITMALPEMINNAENPMLRQGFVDHFEETRQHVTRLEQVFGILNRQTKGMTCEAIDGILAEAEQVVGDVEDKKVRDVALAISAQAVEHYEISRYGSLIALAAQLGYTQCIPILRQTLDEEKAADRKLTEVSEAEVNRKAA